MRLDAYHDAYACCMVSVAIFVALAFLLGVVDLARGAAPWRTDGGRCTDGGPSGRCRRPDVAWEHVFRHTSDWHTSGGPSTVTPRSRRCAVCSRVLTAQVRENDVDVVIVAGDVFDSGTPAAAYTLLSDTLRALAETGAEVIVTSGNHDSAARLGFQAGLLREGIHVPTDPSAIATPVTVTPTNTGLCTSTASRSSSPRCCATRAGRHLTGGACSRTR